MTVMYSEEFFGNPGQAGTCDCSNMSLASRIGCRLVSCGARNEDTARMLYCNPSGRSIRSYRSTGSRVEWMRCISEEVKMQKRVLVLTTSAFILACGAVVASAQQGPMMQQPQNPQQQQEQQLHYPNAGQGMGMMGREGMMMGRGGMM